MYQPKVPEAIQPTEIVGGCIAIFENAWKNPQETIDEIESVVEDPTNQVTFTRATTEGNLLNLNRTNSHLGLSQFSREHETVRKINNQFFDVTFAGMNYYQPKFAEDSMFRYNEGFNLLKYQTGQEYKAHFDGTTIDGRAFSPIVYLNDDYTGGELEFVNFDIKIKPKAGTLIIFPSNYPYAHIAHPVKTGTKYAIVTWLHDRA